MPTIRVQPNTFDTGAEITSLLAGRSDIGGIASFLGTVRDTAAGRPITAMTLEHYPGMTERALIAIAAEAERRWPLLGCTIIHRIGRLSPGDPIVLVVTASLHRQAALDATAFLIDFLKTEAPFWKQEHFKSGETTWVDAKYQDTLSQQKWSLSPPAEQAPE